MPKGFFILMLHAHLPFIRHPEHENFMEEDWLFEAITETYIPLLDVFERLVQEGVDFRITMSLTPPLCAMLTDELLKNRFERYLHERIELAEKELHRTQHLHEYHPTAQMYHYKFNKWRDLYYNVYNRDLVGAFRKFQEMGKLQIVTCGATHGFLPLMNIHPQAVNAQIAMAQMNHIKLFGKPSTGIWNGECGYYPGLEHILAKHSITHFFTDTHGVMYADVRPKYGVFAPIQCENGVNVFGRDAESSKSVWSSKEGYPGDADYRDFYRDIGYDLDFDYIKPYIQSEGIRCMTGFKYHRITGQVDLAHKQPYNPYHAKEKTTLHAGDFMNKQIEKIEALASIPGFDRKPMIFSPYDAELYGHWWYEGPDFIYFLCKKIFYDQNIIEMKTPDEYLSMYPKNQPSKPSFSSWGNKGYAEVWLERNNDWIYRHLHKMSAWMVELAEQFAHHPDAQPGTPGLLNRALNQCSRELLLAQSSDWAFIMKTQTTVPYAVKRTKQHYNRFKKLMDMILSSKYDEEYLYELEWKDNLFWDSTDFRVYAEKV